MALTSAKVVFIWLSIFYIRWTSADVLAALAIFNRNNSELTLKLTPLFMIVTFPKPNALLALLLLALLGSLALPACDKEVTTVVAGRITNIKTGAPIEGAHVLFELSTGTYLGTDPKSVYSDADGNFRFEYTDRNVVRFEIRKEGFLIKPFLTFKRGEENFLDVQMVPRDAFLYVTFKHEVGTNDTLRFVLYNKSYFDEGFEYAHVYKALPIGESFSFYLGLPSDEINYLGWGNARMASPFVAPNRDSIFLNAGDTIPYLITY
jgi:hypothetical protein